MFEFWDEIFITIARNKMRSFLTFFGVFWGILNLVVLMGMGGGFKRGVLSNFENQALGSVWVIPGTTSIAHGGYGIGRNIKIYEEDYDQNSKKIKEIDFGAPRTALNGAFSVKRKDKKSSFPTFGVGEGNERVRKYKPIKGRLLNALDYKEKRNVIIIGEPLVELYYEKDEDPIGTFMEIKGVNFKVVGVFKENNNWSEKRIYMPLTTFKKNFITRNQLEIFTVATDSKDLATIYSIKDKLLKNVSGKYNFSKEDKPALEMYDSMEDFKRVLSMFFGIDVLLWIVAIGTLTSGLIGVSNIMMIAVKERTKEIGIKRAIGAKSYSILLNFIMESISITFLAGYIGLLIGTLFIEGIGSFMRNNNMESAFFKAPTVDFNLAIISIIILIIGGSFAGFFPALRVAKITPIEAMRD